MKLYISLLSILSNLFFIFRVALTAELPIVATPSPQFYGYDGQWSAISVEIGTSQQQQWLSLFPSTLSSETWVIGPNGCDETTVCIQTRGGIFYPNLSTTFQNIGYYELGLDPQLGNANFGDYGLDTVTLDDVVSEPGQVIAIINTTDFLLGQLGLGAQEIRLNGSADHLPFLSSLVQNNGVIPSHSYGYTAGAYYRLKSVPASLTLGGVDVNRFVPNSHSFTLSPTYAPVVAINSISLSSSGSSFPSNWNSNPLQLLNSSQADVFTIDSSTPYLWLPEAVCDNFANALNLIYNDTLQLYLFPDNSSTPEVLSSWDLNFTFSLSNLPNSTDNLEITLPYDAFNLQLSFPFPKLDATYNSAPTNYFPLRRATSSNQYTIGRVFLQETYLTVDYERNNFSISQAIFTEEAISNVNLLAITRPSTSAFAGPPSSNQKSGLSTGAKAGIGVGAAIAVLAILAVVAFLCIRRKRKSRSNIVDEKSPKRRSVLSIFHRSPETGTPVSELLADKRQPTEIPADASNSRFELSANPPVELSAGDVHPAFFASREGLHSTTTFRNDPRRPTELDPSTSGSKYTEASADSERAGSPAPVYSKNQKSKRFSSSISPFSPRHSQAFGTTSSSEQEVSPVGNSGSHNSSDHSRSPLSPVSPEATTFRFPRTFGPMPGTGTGTGTNESRSTDSGSAALLSPQVPTRTPSRSPSRSSRFVEEGIDENENRSSSQVSGRTGRFSWEY